MKSVKLLIVVFITNSYIDVIAQTQPCEGLYYFHENQGMTCWTGFAGIYKGGDATFTTCVNNSIPIENGALKFDVSKTTGWWNTLLYVGGGESANWLWYGKNPVLNIDIKWISGSNDLEIEVADKNDEAASIYIKNYITPSTEYKTVSIPAATLLSKNSAIDFSRISFVRILGYGDWGIHTASTILIKNILVTNQANCKYSEMVKVNQLGYLPDLPKFAIIGFQVRTQTAPTIFTVKESATNAVVYTGTLTKRNTFNPEWQRSGDDVFYGDFSSLKTPGSYYIEVASLSQRSSNFYISSTVYNNAFCSALRFFYYARSGEGIVEPYAEGYTRPGYYINDSQAAYESNANKTGTRNVRGGWFDAGDPHKDMHAQPITMYMLLNTLEDFKTKVTPGYLNIPNTSADISDLYALVKYQLDWIKKMYNDDGSVQMWAESPNNSINDDKCLVSDVSTFSASTLAMIYAKAYRSFKKVSIFNTYADSLLMMAEKSWHWLQANPKNYNPKRPNGKEYSYYKDDHQDSFIRMNAAVELFETTGETEYHTYFKNVYNKLYSQDWYDWQLGSIPSQIQNDWGSFGYYEYIFSKQPTVDITIQNELKERYIKLADWLKYRGNNVEYSPAIAAPNHIFWGSNGLLMGNIYTLIKVYEYTNDASYLNAAYENLHWVLGRNPVNTCMLSGFGSKSTYFFSGYWKDYMNQPHGYMTGGI
ncbi:MAG TPA: glycoside hydrolase family 9 protein, partial [Bacteroidales bacterium]